LEKLGILHTPGTGARPFAMGGAYTAVCDDAYALLYNPAGLAQMKRKELSFGIHHVRDEISNDYLGIAVDQTSSFTSFGHFALAYPYPTYRGSLVLGFGVFRVGDSDIETGRNGVLDDIPATTENIYLQSGTIYQYHIGLGADISPHISLGADLVVWDESVDFTEEIVYEDAGSTAVHTDNVAMDLDGISFNLGVLIRLNEYLRAGFMFSSPTWLSYRGEGVIYYDITYSGPYEPLVFDPEYGVIEEEYTLPMKFSGGLSLTLASVLLAADVTYTDYSQTEWYGLTLIDTEGTATRDAFKDVWSYRLGAEITLPKYPVRIRGGYSYTPLAMTTTEEILYLQDDKVINQVFDFEVEKERHLFTAGVGTLIDRVLTVDLCVAFGGFERDTGYLREKRDVTEILVSSAYRF
jgi:hypothetical protein